MNTFDLLIAKYGGPFIGLDVVQKDFFPHLGLDALCRRAREHKLGFPVTRIEPSQKSALAVHLGDLAAYLDVRRLQARKEHQAIATTSLPADGE